MRGWWWVVPAAGGAVLFAGALQLFVVVGIEPSVYILILPALVGIVFGLLLVGILQTRADVLASREALQSSHEEIRRINAGLEEEVEHRGRELA